jgi:hypothetical protein
MKMRNARLAIAMIAAFLVLSSAMGQSAATAAAQSNDTCWSGRLGTNGAVAACSQLRIGEKVRAVVKCDGFWSDYYRYGGWATRSMQRSEIYCDKIGTRSLGHWYETLTST